MATRTRTPGQPVTFTRGFLVPVAFPNYSSHRSASIANARHEYTWVCPPAQSATISESGTFNIWIICGMLPYVFAATSKSVTMKLHSFLQSSDEFVLSEITNIQPNYQASLSSNDTASLLIIPRTDFSDIKVIQDYRDKSVLKGFSSAGGLWTVLSFIFGVLFGSSLVRVAFGVFHEMDQSNYYICVLTKFLDPDRCKTALHLWTCS